MRHNDLIEIAGAAKGYHPYHYMTILNWERVVQSNERFRHKLDEALRTEYAHMIHWLDFEHRILVHLIPRTSGVHVWGIWQYNTEKVRWEEVPGRWDELEDVLLVALNMVENKTPETVES